MAIDNRNLCDDIKYFKDLRGAVLARIDKTNVTLLKGNDNYHAQFPSKT